MIPEDVKTELKLCPFCGGKPTFAAVTDVEDNYDHCFSLSCAECGIEMSDEYKSGVVEAWNRRAILTDREARTGWHSHDGMRLLNEALDGLWKEAETAYCRGLDRLQMPECLGWEAKVANGSFGRVEFEAHRNAKELIGRHFGIAHAVKAIRAMLSASPYPSLRETEGEKEACPTCDGTGKEVRHSICRDCDESVMASSAKEWAKTWHRTVETICVLIGINGSGSPEEILSELQAKLSSDTSALLLEAEKALEPFSRAADRFDGLPVSELMPQQCWFTTHSLRAARSTLAKIRGRG